MRYTVYCDESRHEPRGHRYMAIGGLWVRSEEKERITRDLRILRRSLNFLGEAKWSKVNLGRFDHYCQIVDYFAKEPHLEFRVIIVDQSKVDLSHHDGDEELGFYKFYYEMLEKWIEPTNEYLILLDFKQNRGSSRYQDLKRILSNRAAKLSSKILDLNVIDSSQSQLAQLCDILTGATATAYCGDQRAGSAKESLIEYIEASLSLRLREHTASPSRCKFNIFQIDLAT